jgi:hypothetical protein
MMKKLPLITVTLLAIMLTMELPKPTYGLTKQSAPYATYTIGPNGRYVQTQTAYEPAGYLDLDLTLNQPEDMILVDDNLYIADTGNRRVLRFNEAGVGEILIDNLQQPTGIHVNEAGELYIADKGARVVYQYSQDMTLIKTYGRPSEPFFGENSPYVPMKVATGPRGIVYIAGEGSTAGLMQLNYAGEFLSFFGTNVTTFSWLQALSNFFGISRASNIPTSPINVALDQKGSVFTVSPTPSQQVKKFNIASSVILSMSSRTQPVSVHINDFDNIYTISSAGIIGEYDSYGNLIFEFGGLDSGNRIAGLYVNPVDIVTDAKNDLLVLDKGTGKIQILQRSEFAQLVHEGLINFKDGVYSLEQWETIIRMNSMFALANASLARGYYRLESYQEALNYYAIAFDRGGFSEAFWQLRYAWLEANLGIVFIFLIVGLILYQVWRRAQKRILATAFVSRIVQTSHYQRAESDLQLMKHILVHPLDTYQDIKHLKKSSVTIATIIYLLVLIVSVFEVYATGFIFSTVDLNNFHLGVFSVTLLGGIGLFILANYLVATITNGEGWLKDIYIATAHALVPYLILTPILTIVSNALTYNEIVVYQIIDIVRYAWSAILIVLMIKEIHNYTIGQLIKNIFLTIFTLLMIVLVGFLLYVLTAQVFNFIEGIIREVILRG